MSEDLSKYLDAEPTGYKPVARKQTRKSNTSSGWSGGYKRSTIPKGDTGTGRKSTRARERCQMEGCQAFASPAHSGYCSWHESQNLVPGERPEVLRTRACKIACVDCTGFCSAPEPGEDEPQYCDACIRAINNPEANDDLDELEL